VVVDLADGRVLADHPVAPVLSVAFLPGLVATAVVDESRRVVVTAIDPLTGAELWRYREDRAFPVAAGDLPVITAAGCMVVLSGTSGPPVLLSASGARVDPGPVESGWNITWQGWFTTEHSDPERGKVQRVFRPGEPPVEVAGRLLDRRVDDGSAPGLEVSAREKTFGWDSRTAERRWQADISADPEGRDSVLVIDGTVFLVGPTDVVALDAETGATVWTAPRLAGSYAGDLFTDGPHLLLVEAPEDASSTGYVTILDRRDGGFVHRLALPDGAGTVVPVGRHLITVDGNEIVGLG
jgi:outer membrane protein assembly factor BamB